MDRRDFLKYAGLAAAGLFVPGFSAWAAEGDSVEDHRLVVVFLRGAADGLSVIAPYDNPDYYKLRPNIAIAKPGQENGLLDLDGHFGLHPALAPLLPLWQNKSMSFVVCSGSPDPTRSHFDAQDFMETGMPGCRTAPTGWLNRTMAHLPQTKHPLRAINIGSTVPRILQGAPGVASYTPRASSKGQPVDKPVVAAAFQQMYEGRGDDLGQAFAEGIRAHVTLNNELDDEMMAANQGAPSAKNFKSFGSQLGQLLAKDQKIKVAFVALGGFDTHVSQGAGKGQLANQLATLGNGLSQLVTGLGDSYKKTTILVMSEFGRTVKENGNQGTDHGHGNMLWVLGGSTAGGKIYGDWRGLANGDLFEGRDLPVTTDFRNVTGTVVREHLKLSDKAMQEVFPDFVIKDKNIQGIIT